MDGGRLCVFVVCWVGWFFLFVMGESVMGEIYMLLILLYGGLV